MLKTYEWLDRVRTFAGTLIETARKRLDEHAERDRGGWAARMEYRRRYTNPDEAKRARTPPESTAPSEPKK